MKNLIFLFLFLVSFTTFSQNFEGIWKGEIKVADSEILIELIIRGQRDSFIYGVLFTPEVYILMDSTFNQSSLHLKGRKSNTYFKGKLGLNKNQLSGELFLNDTTLQINLFRGDKAIYRPQEPKKPYPYNSEDVSFFNTNDSVSLSGTLTIPQNAKKCPAVILQSGSLPTNRNAEGNHHKPFLVLADYLTRNGIAVLRYDDRGIGGSSGSFWNSTTEDLACDLQAGYQFLATHKNIDSTQIGLIGHSEGGLVVAIEAAKNKNYKFIVILGSPGIALKEVFNEQPETNFKNGEMSLETLQLMRKISKRRNLLAEQNTDPKIVFDSLVCFEKEFINVFDKQTDNIDNKFAGQIQFYSLIQRYSSIHSQFNIRTHPAEYIEKVTCSVLVINGSKDMQVKAKINQDAIREALIKGGNKDFELIEMDGINHFFQECETGTIKEALELEQTFSPIALDMITKWILERVEIK